MKRTLIGKLKEKINEKTTIDGWVHAIRKQKKMQFIIVRDKTGLVQAIHERKGGDDPIEKLIDSLTSESAIEISGVVVKNDQVKLQQIEIVIDEIKILNLAMSPLPIDPKETSLENRLDWRFLDLRQPSNLLVFQVQTTIEQEMRNFWIKNGFIEIHSPKFMGSASESGAELFRVEYFGKYAYLAQSPQFYKQMAMAAGFDRVFEIGPVFRANPSFTSRHDTEFTSVDVEISWIKSHEDVMHLEEQWLHEILKGIKEEHGERIKEMFKEEVIVPDLPFPRIKMAEAYKILEKIGHTIDRGSKGDLDPEGERLLAKYIKEHYKHEFVFVTDYPISVRPFYHMRYEDEPTITKSFDLIWKGLEVTTGAQREHRYDILLKQIKEKGLRPESIQYYLDFFKYGCPPHGGYGFGLTRMLMVLLGFKNVREVTYLYRGVNRLTP
ncbi:MAG: aspartate--tRNA(Asn) ligase [Candidatus Portnoybacteria bacterium RBG_19FT_COMBO_36_7]|uniref:Aspartate--tRNA ligase n=1 Tax=Candidatus Portnoybacteria bacterium RBG_19FT_COMBO_36_7 TaxID=1801992 RepID=A0A1G2F654_9BACT|nr:MAG: aspartate--tRNA(Asn) ligase [Candidatus Portnoybacteria bacterium RBG_19FT_COMBO_36_7]